MNAQVFNKDIQHLQTAYKALGEVLNACGDNVGKISKKISKVIKHLRS